jgi:hypothetical protein
MFRAVTQDAPRYGCVEWRNAIVFHGLPAKLWIVGYLHTTVRTGFTLERRSSARTVDDA